MENDQRNHIISAFYACRDGLVRSLLKMSVQPTDVDDILQETVVRVLSVGKKRVIQSPKDYLFVVSRNLVLEKLSRQSREIATDVEEVQISSNEASAESSIIHKQKFEKFCEAVRELPDKQRHAILLRKLYGFSHDEIAAKMDVSVSSVEKYIANGIKHCRKIMLREGFDFEDAKKDTKKVSRETS